jgi:hypothetical protein
MEIAANLFLIAAAVCLLLTLALLLVYRRLRIKALVSANWPTASGTVTGSGLDKQTDSEGGPTYAAVVRYTYAVGGKEYRGDRLGWGGRNYTTHEKATAVAARYPVGQAVQVYYDPQRPETALLEPAFKGGMSWVLWLAVTCAVLAIVFLGSHFLD